jgi:hypothetical protein
VNPIHIERTGHCERPWKVLDPVWLADAVSGHRKITLQTLADALGMHHNTLWNYFKIYNVYNCFTNLLDHDLDILTQHPKQMKPKGSEALH